MQTLVIDTYIRLNRRHVGHDPSSKPTHAPDVEKLQVNIATTVEQAGLKPETSTASS